MPQKEEPQLERIRHSLSHLMSMAIMEIYPEAGLGVGPAIENGFYQDYGLPEPISPELLPKLEKRIKELIKQNIRFEQHNMSFSEALKLYKKDPYKSEVIRELKKAGEKKVSFYRSDWFENLCKGPHVKLTKEINPKAFKLTKIAGAYWRGNEKNKMLTRVYGVAFATEKELKDYLNQQAEAEKRDHRKLGKELDLFVFSDLVGKGLPLLTPKGAIIRQELERFITDEETKRGYLRTYTPDMAKVELYKKSGHWQHYQDNMYPPMNIDGEEYVLRPMTCPHQFMIYASRPRSYRELPLRYAEIAKQYRKEQSGELSGLIRVMAFSLADAHIICRPDQVEEEFKGVLELIEYVMKTFGIDDYWYRFSKWDPKDKKKYVNKPKEWKETQAQMKKILDKIKTKYAEAEGEAAFYGPKLDIQLRNVNGKEETAFTVQIDFDLPEKFDLTYIDEKGNKKRPMAIHRSSIGCLERTMAFLIEHYAGAFPVWLSPVQAQIIPISQKFNAYAEKVAKRLKEENIRTELNDSDETLGRKIRHGELQKIPYLLIVGEKEQKAKLVAVRDRKKGDLGPVKVNKFVGKIKDEIEKKK
ncbi:MAG: threonine--tRNA ligase [Candidatus Portnoybacteria bacterium CG_4_8_14_3_um_filter_44_15]|uniref:Threonine--tRNA ligase n=4 Tax=Candidatus Portnoyibacteriota TaxID=1817913 RepID=A0A2M7YMA3_9BACT|nr:MAG: threonine--tRNA ligase [Parcubacteria group bacterium CG1_02_44_65]PIW74739.1 MAG: threonine--tRNA ligase [Candidatus Portnoybacteria bacterium CG_4_8_14_3_um_filter_44_15]PJA64109.1 MAG: threonine--tRNA ligase [Candidatus Portnoybacteria bacterium CG_4_9_14_3_um_filter_43_11]PJE59427.1 MAG: threonine--tRNA ligase [Candidatus Portnoybacteria bacterium CG10_big_fil_rev_8_21_14_0_10_43_39]